MMGMEKALSPSYNILLKIGGFVFSWLIFSAVLYFVIGHFYELPTLRYQADAVTTWHFFEASLIALWLFATGSSLMYILKV